MVLNQKNFPLSLTVNVGRECVGKESVIGSKNGIAIAKSLTNGFFEIFRD